MTSTTRVQRARKPRGEGNNCHPSGHQDMSWCFCGLCALQSSTLLLLASALAHRLRVIHLCMPFNSAHHNTHTLLLLLLLLIACAVLPFFFFLSTPFLAVSSPFSFSRSAWLSALSLSLSFSTHHYCFSFLSLSLCLRSCFVVCLLFLIILTPTD